MSCLVGLRHCSLSFLSGGFCRTLVSHGSRFVPAVGAACIALAAVFAAADTLADDALPQKIDALIEARATGPLAPLADDSEFVRRVYLDLTGRIPSADETKAFLADGAADKRAQLIDRLLQSSEYPRRMRELWHVMLMERRGTSPEWEAWLEKSLAGDKPWNQMVREMLAGNPDDVEELRGSEFFLTKRLENYGQNPVDYDALTRDIGRLFLGVDLQCANCHNHLFVDDYKQIDYKGLFLFTSNTFNRQADGRTVLGEKLLNARLEFSSVFDKEPMAVGPRLPFAQEIEIPVLAKGEEYAVPPDPKTRHPGVPKFSPRRVLSEELPKAETPGFARNFANRLWFVAMGRGLIDPLDLAHEANPPSHPEVLQLLADEAMRRQFDIRGLLRDLLLTRTYQRTSAAPPGEPAPPPDSFLLAIEKGLSAEQMTWSVLRATETLAAAQSDSPPGGLPKLAAAQAAFEKAFASPPMDPEVEFRPSVKAALFLSNDNLVLTLLSPKPGNLMERLEKIEDGAALTDELYLAVLSRHPSDEERATVTEYLAKRAADRSTAIRNLAWALISSSEFCLNH